MAHLSVLPLLAVVPLSPPVVCISDRVGRAQRDSGTLRACLELFYKTFFISTWTVQSLSYNFPFEHFHPSVFTLFILAQGLPKQDMLLKSYFSCDMANAQASFSAFFFLWKSWNFQGLCSEPTQTHGDGEWGVLEISRFTSQHCLVQTELLSKAVGGECGLETDSWCL